jgi:hypothetical protein
MVELYLHSPIRIHGVMLNLLNTEITIPFLSFTTDASVEQNKIEQRDKFSFEYYLNLIGTEHTKIQIPL